MKLSFATLVASLASAPYVVVGNMYDVVMPQYTSSCTNGCLPWASAGGTNATFQKFINAMFADPAVVGSAGNSCAMPAAHAGDNECDCGEKDGDVNIYDSYEGPWCFCKDPVAGENATQYCVPAKHVPEQINLQLAASNVVVVGFVTYEDGAATNPPVAIFSADDWKTNSTITGVTHFYAPPGRNTSTAPAAGDDGRYAFPYNMHYVRLPQLQSGHQYSYKVKSGSDQAVFSQDFSFRAPVAAGETDKPTRIATYGDMGHSHHNCMANLLDDCTSGKVDAIFHMGDHCYNIGFSNDRRGDAYMNAFQNVLTSCPWFPIIGNHESSDGDHFKHYEAIAWGEVYGSTMSDSKVVRHQHRPARPPTPELRSTATTALGRHLTQGTFYGLGLHGPVPSNTSRYGSVDVGLIHYVGLDLNDLDSTQLAWLQNDLAYANGNRDQTPWIIVSSHFPVFHSKMFDQHLSLDHYLEDENEVPYDMYAKNVDFVQCDKDDETCETVDNWMLGVGAALHPLFRNYGVDIYNAGHVHSYESTWPLCDFTKGELCDGEQSFDEPRGTIHITEGNGGVPGVNGEFGVKSCTAPGGFCRMTGTGGAYARITAYNSSTLTYEHVVNNGGNVTDSWTIVQSKHGNFTTRS